MMRLELLSQSPSLALGSSVPIGQRGLVHITGRNDVSTRQQLGMHWVVKDPDGVVVENFLDWEFGYTGPGDAQEFIGGRFDLDKLGTYTIAVNLLMNPANPVVVDSYEGDLCTTTTEVPPEYELIQQTIYPYAYVYDGDVESSIFTFQTAAFVPAAWAAKNFADALESEVEKEGGRVLELTVYADKTPLLWTDFRIEVTGTPLGEAESIMRPGIAVGIPIWAAILIIALGIALLIAVITWSIQTIVATFTRKPISPEIKEPMSRGTLITLANDFEEKLERTPTSPEELEKLSDEELREYCDELAEEIVPPEISWLPLAILGGVGILGIGAAVALATARRKE